MLSCYRHSDSSVNVLSCKLYSSCSWCPQSSLRWLFLLSGWSQLSWVCWDPGVWILIYFRPFREFQPTVSGPIFSHQQVTITTFSVQIVVETQPGLVTFWSYLIVFVCAFWCPSSFFLLWPFRQGQLHANVKNKETNATTVMFATVLQAGCLQGQCMSVCTNKSRKKKTKQHLPQSNVLDYPSINLQRPPNNGHMTAKKVSLIIALCRMKAGTDRK